MKHQELPIIMLWEKATVWILDKTEKFPKSSRFSLASILANATLDFLEHIIEAKFMSCRKPVLQKASITLEKIRFFLRISCSQRYLSEKQYLFISKMVDETGRMIGGWLKEVAK